MNPQLVEKLNQENYETQRFLITQPLLDTIEPVKQLAERKLLSLTSKAIDIIEEVADYGAPKERLQAACEILDRSPATKKQDLLLSSDQSFPIEAFKLLVEGMGKMFAGNLKILPLKQAEQTNQVLVPKKKKKKEKPDET